MRAGLVPWLFLAGCGRVGFDPLADAITPPVPGPQVWYRFEDPPDDGVLDSAGHGYDGHCTAPLCPALAAGHVGSAYDFSGGAYVAAPGTGAVAADAAVTIAGWVLFRSMSNQAAFSKPLSYMMACCYNSWQIEVDLPAQVCATGPGK